MSATARQPSSVCRTAACPGPDEVTRKAYSLTRGGRTVDASVPGRRISSDRASSGGPPTGGTLAHVTIGLAPMLTSGADHLDAPSLGSISVNPNDSLNVSKVRGPLDINDVYAFRGSNASRTVLAMTVNPAINVLGPTTFQPGAEYILNVDTGTDAVADTRITTSFGLPDGRGIQHYTVKQDGRAVASGFTDGAKGRELGRSGVMAFAGMRSDPFFFDLLGFLGSVKGQGTRTLNDGNESDFFVGLNTLAIVVEVPNASIGGSGTNIGVWATTSA